MKFVSPEPIDDYYIYYVNSTDPYEVTIQHGFQHELEICPTVCKLREANNEDTLHPAILSFEEDTGNISLISNDSDLIGTDLSL